MSDYLANLVQRARGEAATLHPLVQPVFVPTPADFFPTAGESNSNPPGSPPRARAEGRARVLDLLRRNRAQGEPPASVRTSPATPDTERPATFPSGLLQKRSASEHTVPADAHGSAPEAAAAGSGDAPIDAHLFKAGDETAGRNVPERMPTVRLEEMAAAIPAERREPPLPVSAPQPAHPAPSDVTEGLVPSVNPPSDVIEFRSVAEEAPGESWPAVSRPPVPVPGNLPASTRDENERLPVPESVQVVLAPQPALLPPDDLLPRPFTVEVAVVPDSSARHREDAEESFSAGPAPAEMVYSEHAWENLPEPAPAVHVSIGRIEVRAVMPPAPQSGRRPQSPRPRVSLEEYLESQNQRRRP